MKRLITLMVDVTDEEIEQVIPSGTVWLYIHKTTSQDYGELGCEAEIVDVKCAEDK